MLIELDQETALFVAIACELRLQELEKIEPTAREGSLCREQYDGLTKFCDNLRMEMMKDARRESIKRNLQNGNG